MGTIRLEETNIPIPPDDDEKKDSMNFREEQDAMLKDLTTSGGKINRYELKQELKPLVEMNSAPDMDALLSDTAVRCFFKHIKAEWIISYMKKKFPDYSLPQSGIVEMRVWVARNLYMSNTLRSSITQKIVHEELQRILDDREKYKDIPIFKGRHLLVVANDETHSTFLCFGTNRTCAPKQLLDDMRRQQGDKELEANLVLPGFKGLPLSKAKETADDKIENYPVPMTLVLFAHGDKGFLTLHGEDYNPAYSFSHDDLMKTLDKRAKKYEKEFKDPKMRDIVLICSCSSQDVVQRVNKDYDSKHPIDRPAKPLAFICSSEYGQPSKFDSSSHSSSFFSEVVDTPSSVSTIGTVIKNHRIGSSNASVFISDTNDTEHMRQIAMREETDQ